MMYSIDSFASPHSTTPFNPWKHLMMQSHALKSRQSAHTSLMVSLALGWLLMHHPVDLSPQETIFGGCHRSGFRGFQMIVVSHAF